MSGHSIERRRIAGEAALRWLRAYTESAQRHEWAAARQALAFARELSDYVLLAAPTAAAEGDGE